MAPPSFSLEAAQASLYPLAEALLAAILYHRIELLLIAATGILAYWAARHYIPGVAETLFARNLYGIDINKTTPKERQALVAKIKSGTIDTVTLRAQVVPESLGIIAGAVYLSLVIVLGLVLSSVMDCSTLLGPLTTITIMLLLGFVDDVLDVRWRHKLLLSALGALPLLAVYDGSTSVLIPPTVSPRLQGLVTASAQQLQHYLPASGVVQAWSSSVLGHTAAGQRVATIAGRWWAHQPALLTPRDDGSLLLYLGPFYLVYLSFLCIFCTNSINILAGVNGVEVGQSVVIAVASVVYNVLQLRLDEAALNPQLKAMHPHLSSSSDSSSEHQIRALALLVPFVGVSVALYQFNRYPARVFVGDSFTYFAGTVLAVAGITGVYSKTLLLFFAPQIFNFLISLPQLFHIVPCPRHRVPTWDPKTNVLCNSHNLTILNAILAWRGPMKEAVLARWVLWLQGFTCGFGFVVRYVIAAYMYEKVE